MNMQTFWDIFPVYLLLSLLPLVALLLGAVAAPFLYEKRRWLAILLNIVGFGCFIWLAFIVVGFAAIDFNPYAEWGVPSLLLMLLGLVVMALFFAALEWVTFRTIRHFRPTRQQTALDYFHQGYSCAQSVLAPFAGELGISEEQALRLASGLGAGIGRMRETCGAFCGLTLVAGHCRGNVCGEAGEKEKIFSLVREEAERFRCEFGSLRCRDLLHLEEEKQEGARPQERSAAYYAARPCERCVAFCEARARELLNTRAAHR